MAKSLKYVIKHPTALETLAIRNIGEWIALQAKKFIQMLPDLEKQTATRPQTLLSHQIETIRNLLERNVPKILHDTIAREVIQNLKTLSKEIKHSSGQLTYYQKSDQQITIGLMIETLFTKNLTCLYLNSKVHEEMFQVTSSRSYRLSGLVMLHLGQVKVGVDETDIIDLLKELRNLKYLFLHDNYFTNGILKCVAENCVKLEELDSGECRKRNVNDDTIDIFGRMSNLRRINLYETAVSAKGIEKLLLSCNNIEYIHLSTNILQTALERIESSGNVNQLNLNSYINYHETTLEDMKLYIKICPLINKVTLRHSSRNNLITALKDLNSLRELELKSYDFYAAGVKETFLTNECTRNLIELSIYSMFDIDSKALLYIGRTCPNLESLNLHECIFVTKTEDVPKSDIPIFKNLKSLTLEALSSEPTQDQIYFLLSNSPNIENITIKSIFLSDDTMLSVLDLNPMVHIKKLRYKTRKINIFDYNQDILISKAMIRIAENNVNFFEVDVDILY